MYQTGPSAGLTVVRMLLEHVRNRLDHLPCCGAVPLLLAGPGPEVAASHGITMRPSPRAGVSGLGHPP